MFNTNPWSHLNDKINPFEHLSPIRLFILLIQHWFLKVFSYPRLTSISKISYGRFKGSVMANILDTAPSYVLWLIFNVKHFTLAKPSLNDLTKFVVEQYKIDNNDIEFIDSILRSSSYNSDPFFYEREKIILRNCCLRYSYDNQSSIDKAQELLDVRLKVSKVMLDSLFVIHRHLEYQENLRSEKIEYPVQDCNWDKYNDQLDMDQQDPEFY